MMILLSSCNQWFHFYFVFFHVIIREWTETREQIAICSTVADSEGGGGELG